jgi:hypothetical protein
MATVTSRNREEWMANEMARRAGKPNPKPANPFADYSREELKQQKAFIKEALKESKPPKEPKEPKE